MVQPYIHINHLRNARLTEPGNATFSPAMACRRVTFSERLPSLTSPFYLLISPRISSAEIFTWRAADAQFCTVLRFGAPVLRGSALLALGFGAPVLRGSALLCSGVRSAPVLRSLTLLCSAVRRPCAPEFDASALRGSALLCSPILLCHPAPARWHVSFLSPTRPSTAGRSAGAKYR